VANTIRLNIASVSIDNVQAKVHQRNKDDLKLLGDGGDVLEVIQRELVGLAQPEEIAPTRHGWIK
jgi:hypothetical protein